MKINSRILAPLVSVAGVALFVAAMWVLYREIHTATLAQIAAQIAATPLSVSLLALALTALSYTLLTLYDMLAMQAVQVRLPWRSVAPIAFSAFAIGHNVGVASLSGGTIRYRAYSLAGLSSPQIASIIALISVTFGVGASALLGVTLLLEPASALTALNVSVPLGRAAGGIALVASMGYLLMLGLRREPLTLGPWSFRLPPLSIGIRQLLLASADILCASLIPYVLIQTGGDLHYFTFLSAFLLALAVGVISNVPGGIGVFESAMILLLPQVPVPALLGGILAYRLVYYLLPLVLAVSVIAFREAHEHRQRLGVLTATGLAWGTRLLPQALGAAVFLAGAYLLLRGAFPLHLGPPQLADTVVPLPLLETSHLLSSTIGAALIIVAHGLYRRLRRAWLASMGLLAGGIIASLMQFNGLPQIFILCLLMLLAYVSRAEFFRGSRLLDQRFKPSWIFNIGVVLLALIGIGLIANRNVDYSNELWWQFTFDGEASRMLRASLVALVLTGSFGVARLLRSAPPPQGPVSEAELTRVREIVARSPASMANIALLGDKRFLFHPDGKAFIMYQASGGSFIALNDPVGDPGCFEELLWHYRELCDAAGMRCVFYEVSGNYLPLYIDLGLSFLKLGEEGVVPLDTFSLEGSHRSGLRQAVNKAHRQEAEFSVVPACEVGGILDQLEQVSNSWLQGKSTEEKGFSLGYFDRRYLANFDCAVVRVHGEIVAFANLWPSAERQELSIDLMRYTAEAPKAIMDYLFAQIMLWGKAEGYGRFSLGMAPLSGLERHTLATPWHKFGNLVYHFGENFYNFEGLRQYKDKFDPEWQPRFLACKGGLQTPGVLLDTTILISGGLREILLK